MIEHIKVLKRELSDKNLYLWDVGKLAMWTFFRVAARGLDIKGFITNFPEFQGESIMNRPILSPDALREDPDAFILTAEGITDGTLALVSSFAPCCRWPDALEYNPRLADVPVYFWGMGSKAWYFLRDTARKGVSIRAFLSQKDDAPYTLQGTPVIPAGDVTWSPEDALVILEGDPRWDGDAAGRVLQSGFSGTLFLSELCPLEVLWSLDPYIMLDQAMKAGKRILLCCEDPMGRALLDRIFDTYGVPLAREVSFEGRAGDGSDDIWSLADEDPAKSVLLIHAFSTLRRYAIADAANELGYTLDDHNYSSTGQICYNRKLYTNTLHYENDMRGLASIDYTALGGLPSWARYGSDGDGATRIMVLGGSTSSEVYYPEGWVSRLYRIICAAGKKAVIYNGAVEGDRVFNEMARLVRDIHRLKPDIVISLSGYNDLSALDNKFEKVRQESSFEYWRRIESYMKLIAESEGASYYTILQPVNQDPQVQGLYEAMMFFGQVHRRARVFNEGRREDDFYHDLFSLFLHQTDKHIDQAHYSDRGNQRLAEEIYHIIEDKLP